MKIKYLSKNKMYYLASPYSYDGRFKLYNYLVRLYRFRKVSDTAVHLIRNGYTCIEPIATCHYKSVRYDLPTGYNFWKRRDRWFIRKCDGIVIVTLKGWDISEGVTDEIKYARQRGLDVIYIDPYTLNVVKELKGVKPKRKREILKDVSYIGVK